MEGYGLTEGTCCSTINPFVGPRKIGSIGLPTRGQQVTCSARTAARFPTATPGEVVHPRAERDGGLLQPPDANAETLRDGWLHTGDVGYRDDDGYFFLVDRKKDMIIRGGENIYPREIEDVLLEHAGVKEAAVIGRPDEVRGEEVHALVTPKPNARLDLDELAAYTAERIARYKLPRRFELREDLPKTRNRQDQQRPAARGTLALISRPGPTYGMTRPPSGRIPDAHRAIDDPRTGRALADRGARGFAPSFPHAGPPRDPSRRDPFAASIVRKRR